MDCSLSGSSFPKISQARILEWLLFPSPGHLPDSETGPAFPEIKDMCVPAEEFTTSSTFRNESNNSSVQFKSVTQSCLTLCDPMDCSPPGSSVHGISQARILEWLPFPIPVNLPSPGIKLISPALAGGFFTTVSP